MVNTKVSVIVPVYNAEKYISECIKSILAQTFMDFELLLIDDGSKDSSGDICTAFAKSDSRIKVFHKTNGGVSSARNLGIDKAEGDWITFVDADDVLKQNFLADLLVYDKYDHIVGGNIIFGEKTEQRLIGKEICIDLRSSEAALLDYGTDIKSSSFICYPWGKLYKNSIIQQNGIRFNSDMFLGEDLCFVLEYLSQCENLVLVPCNNYLYRYENQKNKYLMNYVDLMTHSEYLGKCIDRLRNHTGYYFINMHRYITLSFFYHYYEKLKKCKTYKEYYEQTIQFKKTGKDLLRFVLLKESRIKRIYIITNILHPYIGYIINKIKGKI